MTCVLSLPGTAVKDQDERTSSALTTPGSWEGKAGRDVEEHDEKKLEGARPLVDPLVAREHKVTVSQRPRHRAKPVRHSAVPSMEERFGASNKRNFQNASSSSKAWGPL